jgi:hypothetical protein
MQHVVAWWCTLLGIADPLSIQIASGIVGGSTLIYSPFVAWWLFSAIVARCVRCDAYRATPTLGDLHPAMPWPWLNCEKCQHSAPLACVVPEIR